MPKPAGDGLSYFPFDADFFGDIRIKILRGSEYGNTTVIVYLYILCEICKGKGYYVEYSEDFAYVVSCDLNIPQTAVSEIVSLFIEKKVFDKGLFEEYGVLSSDEIQKQYVAVQKRLRKKRSFDSRYILDKSLLAKTEDNCAKTAEICANTADNYANTAEICAKTADNYAITAENYAITPEKCVQNSTKEKKYESKYESKEKSKEKNKEENKNESKYLKERENEGSASPFEALRSLYGENIFLGYYNKACKYYKNADDEYKASVIRRWIDEDNVKPLKSGNSSIEYDYKYASDELRCLMEEYD